MSECIIDWGRRAASRSNWKKFEKPENGTFRAVGEQQGDREILGAWASGNKSAGAALFDRHFGALSRFFRNKAGDAADDLCPRLSQAHGAWALIRTAACPCKIQGVNGYVIGRKKGLLDAGRLRSVVSPFEQLKECKACGLNKPLSDFPRTGPKKQSTHCTRCSHARGYQRHLKKQLNAKSDAPLSDAQRIEAERIAEAERANEDAFARLRDARHARLDD